MEPIFNDIEVVAKSLVLLNNIVRKCFWVPGVCDLGGNSTYESNLQRKFQLKKHNVCDMSDLIRP